MKKILLVLFTSLSLLSFSQTPQEISYQGVARNSSGTILSSQNIGIKLDLHQGSSGGTIVFSETHNKTTNNFGLFTLGIGSVNSSGFSSINWANGPYFLEVSIDPTGGVSYVSVGTQQFMSVPYALYAQTAGNASSTPTITINAPNTVTSAGGSYTINIPASTSYTAGSGININSGVITSTANIVGAGSTSVNGTYPNLTITTPTTQVYTAGPGIDISTSGVISNTATAVTPTITAGNNITINPITPSNSYTVSAPTYSLSQSGNNIDLLQNGTSIGTATLPVATSYSAGNGISISGNVISNTLTPVTPTINSGGVANVTNPSSNVYLVDVPAPSLNYNSGTNELTLTQNGATSTATLNGTGANTVSIVGTGLASVTPTTGSNFTVSVPSPTLSVGSGSISISGGNSVAIPSSSTSLVAGNTNIQLIPGINSYTLNAYTYSLTNNSNTLTLTNGAPLGYTSTVVVPTQSLSIGSGSISISGGNSVAIPSSSTTLVQGNNISLNQTGNTYTVSSPAYSITLPGGNTVQITNGVSTSTAAINATSLTLTGVNNNILSAGGNTVGLNTYTAGTGITITGSAPNYTINNSNPAITPTITGTGVATVNNVAPNYTVNVPMSTYNNSTGVFTTGTQTIAVAPTLTISGNVLRSGPSTNTVNIPVANIVSTNTNISVSSSAGVYSLTAVSANLFGDVVGAVNSTTVTQLQTRPVSNAAPTANQVLTWNGSAWTPSSTVVPILSYTGSATAGTLQSGAQTVTIPNYTLSNTSNTITLNNGTANSTAIIPVPTLTLSGNTLQSGPASNTVSLSGLGGIYSGSGSLQAGTTSVSIGTNTLNFVASNNLKPIANFVGNGTIQPSLLGVANATTGASGVRFIGSFTTTPVTYGNVTGNANGVYITGGSSSDGLFATPNNETGVGTYTTGTGKFVITHSASQAVPTIHLRENSGALSRIKFSNVGVANRFFEAGASVNAADNFSAYSISFHDGTNYKSRFLIYGNGRTSINNLHTAETTFHVMDDNASSAGIASEGFGFEGQIKVERNNPLGVSPTYTRGAVSGNQDIGKINFSAYDGAAFGDGAKIYAKTTENVTGSNKGTELIFAAVPTGTNTNKDAFKINGTGNLEIISDLQIPLNAAAGKVLTSDAAGNASWQTITAPTAPWIQGTGIVTQGILGDKVGIGTNTPQSPLHVVSGPTAEQFRLGNFNQPTFEWIWSVDGTSHLSLVNENNGTAITRLFMDVNTGNLGLGTSNPLGSIHLVNNLAANVGALVDMSATTTTDGVRVVQNGTGNGIFSAIYNTSSNAKALELQSAGTGFVMSAAHTGTVGGAADFVINNASNNSSALNVSTNGGGNAIYAINTNSSNISSVIQASSNSSGVAIYANNTGGSTAQFDNNTPSITFNALNSSSGSAIYASANTGKAIEATSAGLVETVLAKNTNANTTAYAGNFDGGLIVKGKTSASADYAFKVSSSISEVFGIKNNGNIGINVLNPIYKVSANSSNTVATLYSENIVTGSFPNAHGIYGKVSSANSNALAAAIYANNAGAGPSIYGIKNATESGIAGRFELLNTSNSADAVFAETDGTGAAVHAVASSTANTSSALSLWVENGHIKATGANASSSTTVTSISTSTVIGNDVVGKISITTVATAIPANQEMIKVQFAKSYPAGVTPNVIITPSNANAAGVQGYVSVVSNTGFSIFFNVATAAIIRTYTFNYMVIE